ncbi:MAG: hypothetical protein HY272_04720 [Gammaproteobacteria bacterium]|nr:hypothetical protein [Gammaproteobacteria bacterium]
MTAMGHLYKFAEAALAVLQTGSKCSCTTCTLRFFARLRLAIIGLIEFIEVSFSFNLKENNDRTWTP